jgi:YVTN family beta-propeller protein
MARTSVRVSAVALGLFCVAAGMTGAQASAPAGVPAGLRKVGPIAGGFVLPSGRLLRPWGDQIELPGMPFSVTVSPDGKTGYLLVAANRFWDPWTPDATLLACVDLDRRTVLKTVRFDKRLSVGMGMALVAGAKRLFLTDPVGDKVIGLRVPELEIEREVVLPKGSFPVGVAATADASRVYAAANLAGTLVEIDWAAGTVAGAVPVGASPGRVVLSADGSRAYVSNWTGGTVSVVDLGGRRVAKTVAVGRHPEGIVELPGGRAILVVVNGQDEIAEVDLGTGAVRRRIAVAPLPGLPRGSSPSAAVLHPDGDRVLVCLSGDDALATVSLREGRVLGLTPVGWYPVDVALAPDGSVAYVANMKSPTNLLPERHPELWHGRYGKQGTVSVIASASLPDAAATEAAMENLGLEQTATWAAALPAGLKRVVFILKENHTYDDYFGDLGRGDSDPAVCFWGRAHTPNQHAMADRFALCDNFYSEAEMSVEGHSWVEGGYFSDILERFWRLARPRPDMCDPTYWPVQGSIFNECERRGVSYRIYGGALLFEHLRDQVQVKGYVKNETGPGYRPAFPTDVALARRFADDLARGISTRFTYMTLWRDHPEEGGRAVNEALVHDNDQATGIVVAALSRSAQWKETAVFIVQDDPAGNYIDHVSTHRVPCLVVSPWAKPGYIDNHHYSFPSILRTIEGILGLSALSRYDWGATPMTDCFGPRAENIAPYAAIKIEGK